MIKIFKISAEECRTYNISEVKQTLYKTFESLGGLDSYVSKGDKVFLKVNLVIRKPPEAAATTNPIVVEALSEILIAQGATVIIGDSPGGPFNELLLKNLYKTCGMTDAAQNSGASLNFNTDFLEISNPNGFLMKRLTVIEAIMPPCKIISVSKLKTHGMTKMTGAVKNLFGIIPGAMKADYHLTLSKTKDFSNALIDICLFANPILHIMDAITGMEGNGPTSGTPRDIGLILASRNPFALDMAAAYVLDIHPSHVPTIGESISRGLCPQSINDISVIGANLEKFKIPDFKTPQIKKINGFSEMLPYPLRKFVDSNLQPQPVFVHEKCIGCGDCMKNCPPNAIQMINHGPSVDLDKCIRCFCCQELCPKSAVDIKRPLLFRIFSSL